MRVSQRNWILLLIASISAAAATGVANASDEIEVKATAQHEMQPIEGLGQETSMRVTASKIVSGDVVIYAITTRNVANPPVEEVVLDDPIPTHIATVMDGASTDDRAITFSVDGGETFHPSRNLVVNDGIARALPASANKHTEVRWSLESDTPATSGTSVSFRARLEPTQGPALTNRVNRQATTK